MILGGITRLIRTVPLGTGVRGIWYLPDSQVVHTLEDEPIPSGVYFLSPDDTGRFKNWVIEEEPGTRRIGDRTSCEVHPGNDLSASEGCVLPGMRTTWDGVAQSREALSLLRRALGRDRPDAPTWVIEVIESPWERR